MNAMNLAPPQRPGDHLFTDIVFPYITLELCKVVRVGINNSDDLIRIF